MLTRFALFLSLTTLLLFHTGCTLTESLSASTTTTKCEVTVSGGVESPGPRRSIPVIPSPPCSLKFTFKPSASP